MADIRKVVKVPKLVRDGMIPIWTRFQDKVEYRYLTHSEFKRELLEKIVEEAGEVHDDPCAEEFADLLEVTDAAIIACGLTQQQVDRARERKRADRGGFTKGLYLTSFEWGPVRSESA